MSDCGIAIDNKSKSVVLVGADLIHQLLLGRGNKLTLTDFNKIATGILKQFGPAYGVDMETIDFDEWALSCTTKEDAAVLLSYLEDPHAEVAMSTTDYEIAPVQEKKKCLH